MLPKPLKLINPSQSSSLEKKTKTEVIEERADEEDSSSEDEKNHFKDTKVLVRTRDSGEFFLNKAGDRQLNEFRQRVSLAEIDEELKDPDF